MSEEIVHGYRLSPQQKRLWLLKQGADAHAFWSRCAVNIRGRVNPERLEKAIGRVVEEHEILRTTFQLPTGATVPVQVIHPQLPTLPLFRVDLSQISHDETVMLLRAPAMCADLRSMENIVAQVARFYESESAAVEAMQYADFAEWQRELLEAVEGEPGRRHWISRSSHASVSLPFEKRAEEGTLFRPQQLPIELPADISEGGLLACWQILIQRLAGSSPVTLGIGFDGRRHPELVNSVGLYSRYVPLQVESIDERPTIDQLSQRLAKAEKEAAQWQEYFAWPDAVNESLPYFSVCFEERHRTSVFRAEGVTFSVNECDAVDDRFNLKLVSVLVDGRPHLELHYDAGRFDTTDIQRMAHELVILIANAARKPTTPISELDSLSSEERRRIVEGFNQTAEEFPITCIHTLFEAQAQQTPDRVAVVCGPDKATYAQLNERANQLARYLQKLGVGPDVPVALRLAKSVDFIVCMLGVMKAGGAYLPLDVNIPEERLATMLAETRAPVLTSLNALADELANEAKDNCSSDVTPANLAYVIFTSGSTGRPKGIAVEHRQLCNYVHAIDRKVGLSACRSFAIVSTLVADLAHTMLFPSLLTGGTLHLISEDQAANPPVLADYFRQNPIDCLKIVPTHLKALLVSSDARELLPRRHLILGGEACSRSLVETVHELSMLTPPWSAAAWRRFGLDLAQSTPPPRQAAALQGDARELAIWNHYGPTETTVGCVAHRFTFGDSDTITIGTPLPNNTVYVLNEHLRPVPVGVAGELYVGGEGVARGYLNRPEPTAERFMPDPFSKTAGRRFYRTGDRARYLSDGRIEVLGRVDHQLKVRGYRIEPEEIQVALNEHPLVSQSVVVGREDHGADKRLVAYVVAENSTEPEVTDLREFLGRRLPEYMVPSAFVFLKGLPITPNGKIDRDALPEPGSGRREFAAPATPAEMELCRIWATVLGLDEVGINDNFFELGGDSILGIQIIARANQAGMNLEPRQIFRYQTIAELAAVANDGLRPETEQGMITGEVILSPVQARFFELGLPDPHHYNQARLLKLRKPADPDFLRSAVEQLPLHHDALRLRFFRSGQNWKQINSEPESTIPFERIDISDSNETEIDDVLRSQAERIHASLNLQDGPLVRVALFDGHDRTPSYLLIVIHHLAVDTISWGVLLEDLETVYRRLSTAENISLPRKTTSFKTWTTQLAQFAQSSTIEQEIEYWTSRLALSDAKLPVDYSGPNTVASRRTISASLTPAETRSVLQDLPAKHRTQINEVLLTAMARTFTAWMRTTSFLLDLEGHGREQIIEGTDLARTVGWFTTIFPVVLEIEESTTPLKVLRDVKEQLRAVPNRGIGYGLLRYLSERKDVVEQLSRLPQAEVRFNYLGQQDRFLSSSQLFLSTHNSGANAQSLRGERAYLLNIIASVTASETGGQLRFRWTYSENIHATETIERLAETCLAELRALLSEGETADSIYAPSDFPKAKLSQKDLNAILVKLRK